MNSYLDKKEEAQTEGDNLSPSISRVFIYVEKFVNSKFYQNTKIYDSTFVIGISALCMQVDFMFLIGFMFVFNVERFKSNLKNH